MSRDPSSQSQSPSTTAINAAETGPACPDTARVNVSNPIPGIYQTCDQWCMYCPATNRCLAFQMTNARDLDGVFDPVGEPDEERVGGGLALFATLADAEAQVLPPELEAILSGDRDRQRSTFTMDDPLERLGRTCMTLADAYLQSRPDFPTDIRWRAAGPTPLEVLTWYHVLTPARVFRAILCRREAAQGRAGRARDAVIAAKTALVGIERSLTALAAIGREDDDPRIELLTRRLQRFREAVETRFPDARRFVRPGLDADAGTPPRRLARWIDRVRGIRALLDWRHEWSADAPAGDVRGSARRSGASRG